MNMTDKIHEFQGKYRWLSNFWPCEVWYEHERYPSVEHAYQAAKTDDVNERDIIRRAPTPAMAKKAGNLIFLKEWTDSKKLNVMEGLLVQKFRKGNYLSKKLLDTGDLELIEGNNWGDTFWGVCRGQGSNHLGQILMKIREELRK